LDEQDIVYDERKKSGKQMVYDQANMTINVREGLSSFSDRKGDISKGSNARIV